jgi:hypothetical protein
MDRRQYLGLTGTSIVALLGGCSSSDGGSGSGDNPGSTATANEEEETGVETTAEQNRSATATPMPEKEFLVNDDFNEAYRQSTPGTERHTEVMEKVEENYDWAAVQSKLEETDEVEYGEVVLEGLSDVFEGGDLTTWENAKEMAKATRYIIHKGLNPEYRKQVLGEQGDLLKVQKDHSKDFDVNITESGEIENNGYIVLPYVRTLDGETNENGVDIAGEGYFTNMIAEAKGKPSDPTGTYQIIDAHILNPEEREKWMKTDGYVNLSYNEATMAQGFEKDDEKGEAHARWEIYPIFKSGRKNFDLKPIHINGFNRYLAKMILGVPAETENGTPYAQIEEEAHKKIYEDFMDGDFMNYRIRLHNEFMKNVGVDEIGDIKLSEDERLVVEPSPEESYDNSQLYI